MDTLPIDEQFLEMAQQVVEAIFKEHCLWSRSTILEWRRYEALRQTIAVHFLEQADIDNELKTMLSDLNFFRRPGGQVDAESTWIKEQKQWLKKLLTDSEIRAQMVAVQKRIIEDLESTVGT